MLSTTSQFQFAAEFLGMLVAASGLALVTLRGELVRGGWRALAAAGFVVLGAVAFARGSLLVSGETVALGVARLAGAALLAAGSTGWRRGRAAPVAGATVLAAAGVAEAAGASGVATDSLLSAGALALAAGLLAASRGSLAARVAVGAAATLLAVVLVLSVALASVIATAVEHDQLDALGTLAQVDAGEVAARAPQALTTAASLTAALDDHFPARADAANIRAALRALAGGYPAGTTIGYQASGQAPVGASGDAAVLGAAAKVPALRAAHCGPGVTAGASTFAAIRGLDVVAAEPVCERGGARRYGTVLVVAPLDAAFVATLAPGGQDASVALVSDAGVLAPPRRDPPAAVVSAARAGGRPRVVDARLLATASIRAAGGSGVVLLATSTTARAVASRDSLFRTLFVIALGGTVLALGLAALTGERVTAGVRRLTVTAGRVQRGEAIERAGVRSDDEVGVLAGAFDAMVSSIEEQSVAVHDAADAEARLRSRLEAVVAGMGEALVAVDTAGRVTDFNQAAVALTGLGADAAVGRPARDVLGVTGGDVGDLASWLAQPTTEPWGGVADLRRADGARIPVGVSIGGVRGPLGEQSGSVVVLRDLRREREVERMKSEFLSRIGHELRTPLTGILGYADILLRGDVPAEQARAWHAEIVASAKRQLRVIRLLEFFASSGAGRIPLSVEPLDVAALVEAAVAEWSERVAPAHVVTGRAARGLPAVAGDGRWLRLALDELIDNAVKFSPGGRVLVRAGARPALAQGRPPMVEISVRDYGPGMTPDQRRLAFADFVQGDASDTRRFGGLGLGLAFVKRVAEAHGGTVACRSVPGQGTVLAFVVPAAPVAAAGDAS